MLKYNVGDKLFWQINNQYNKYPCIVTKAELIPKIGQRYTIKIKAESWLREQEGKNVWLTFENRTVSELKEKLEDVRDFSS